MAARLEVEPRADLNNATGGGLVNAPEGSAVYVEERELLRRGHAEVRAVQRIERLKTQLQFHGLQQLEVLYHRSVQIEREWAIDEGAIQIASLARRRVEEDLAGEGGGTKAFGRASGRIDDRRINE